MACTALIANPQLWINRRVETIEMLSHEETRRRVSIDFTLSDDTIKDLVTDEGIVVPISVLTKVARRNFDLRDESGRAIPVLGKHQNGQLAHIGLLNAALNALPADLTPEVFEIIAADLRQVVLSEPATASDALGFFIGSAESGDRWRAAIWSDETCRSLLDALWQNYVLFAVLAPGGPNRRVLKYSYGDEFDPTDRGALRDRIAPRQLALGAWRPDRGRFIVLCPGASRAASFHVEIAIPEELRIDTAVLYDFAGQEPLSDADTKVNRASLYANRSLTAESDVDAYVEVVPERIGRASQAAGTSVVVTALLWLGVASGLKVTSPGPAASLLLAGAALYSGVTAVQGKHQLVKALFSATRRWLALVTAAALAGSASLAMQTPDKRPVDVWRGAAIACTIAAIRLAWGAVRAPK